MYQVPPTWDGTTFLFTRGIKHQVCHHKVKHNVRHPPLPGKLSYAWAQDFASPPSILDQKGTSMNILHQTSKQLYYIIIHFKKPSISSQAKWNEDSQWEKKHSRNTGQKSTKDLTDRDGTPSYRPSNFGCATGSFHVTNIWRTLESSPTTPVLDVMIKIPTIPSCSFDQGILGQYQIDMSTRSYLLEVGLEFQSLDPRTTWWTSSCSSSSSVYTGRNYSTRVSSLLFNFCRN